MPGSSNRVVFLEMSEDELDVLDSDLGTFVFDALVFVLGAAVQYSFQARHVLVLAFALAVLFVVELE